eukprot:TRINITY_DN91474_c0_g1_i1.p1 TRINITY_DN91474_c0_g1~~TRINITY_DN91474_c0_g1_i1.p1  ORF type:complete len:1189 (-),score=291.97 TRINITY_DN91474_c0_g1_i1:162-3728(-)
MDFHWQEGEDLRRGRTPKARKSPTSRQNAGSGNLPVIDASERCGTPTGPGSAAGRRALNQSASEPALGSMNASRKDAARRVAAFMERNMASTPQFEAKMNAARMQQQMSIQANSEHDAGFFGNKGAQGFRHYLKSKFGTLVYGWRALDQARTGRLSFYEFCNACRRMGYHGNMKKLWKELDSNRNGHVSIIELDPEVGRYMGTFKLALLHKYGDMLSAWKKGLDRNKNGRIELKEIESCLAELGTDLDPGKLWGMLRPVTGALTLNDLDPDAYQRWQAGDEGGILHKTSMEFVDDMPGLGKEIPLPEELARSLESGAARKWRAKLVSQDQLEAKAEHEKNVKLRLGLHTVPGFKKALIAACGSLYGAWRKKLDLDGNERLTFGEFCQALHRLGFHGDVNGLWKLLDKDRKGYLEFADLDPQADAMVKELKSKLSEKYGNLLLAWVKVMDTNGSGTVGQDAFVKACSDAGFSGDASKCFRLLQPEQTRKFLALEDFDTKAFHAHGRGDFRMISESQPEQSASNKKEMSFEERQTSGFCTKVNQAWEVARREEFAKACRLAAPRQDKEKAPEKFITLCKRKYGTIIAAWRQCLDYDGNGKLTFNEFCEAVRSLGYVGDLRALWKQFGGVEKGYISLKDLSPEEDEIVNGFLRLLGQRYGHLDEAWKIGFHKDPYGSIDIDELTSACKALNWPGDPKKLFSCLQPSPSKVLITIWDMDPCCNREKTRGEKIYASEAKDAVTKSQKRLSFGCFEKVEIEQLHNTSMNSNSSMAPGALSSLQQLRRVLRTHYGTTVAAWRQVLDPRLTGSTCWARFVMCLEECAFSGNKKGLWQDLAPDPEQQPGLKDFDPEASKLLSSFRTQLLENHGSITEAWFQGLQQSERSHMDEQNFVAACEKCGLSCKSWSRLFQFFFSRLGQRSIGLEDLRVLLIGLPLAEQGSAWAAATEGNGNTNQRPSSAKAATSPRGSDIDFNMSSPRQLIQNSLQEHRESQVACITLDGFKRTLIQTYGSLFAAWRDALDADRNGLATKNDISRVCRMLGIKVSRSLWAELDPEDNGQISLNRLDAQVSQGFDALETALKEQHGTCKVGWRKVFDPENTLHVDEKKFKAGCEKLGLTLNAEKLFRLLRPELGRSFLNHEDLWTNYDPNTLPDDEPPGAMSPRSFGGSRPLSATSKGNLSQSRPTSAVPKQL